MEAVQLTKPNKDTKHKVKVLKTLVLQCKACKYNCDKCGNYMTIIVNDSNFIYKINKWRLCINCERELCINCFKLPSINIINSINQRYCRGCLS